MQGAKGISKTREKFKLPSDWCLLCMWNLHVAVRSAISNTNAKANLNSFYANVQ